MTRVGWIGLGKMGLPMSKNIGAAGHEVCAYTRNDAARTKAKAAQFTSADSLGELAEKSDVIFSMISDDKALRDIVLSEGGLASALQHGQIYIDMSTVSPQCSTEVAQAIEASGAQYLRAPVSGSTATAEAGALAVVVSGPEGAHDKVSPLIDTFSAKQFHVGTDEQARYLKLVLNTLVGSTAALLAEALTLGRDGGLSTDQMLEVISQSAVASPLIGYKRDMLVNQTYGAQFSVAQIAKDLDLILDSGTAGGETMPLVTAVRQKFETAIEDGDAEEDFFVLNKH